MSDCLAEFSVRQEASLAILDSRSSAKLTPWTQQTQTSKVAVEVGCIKGELIPSSVHKLPSRRELVWPVSSPKISYHSNSSIPRLILVRRPAISCGLNFPGVRQFPAHQLRIQSGGGSSFNSFVVTEFGGINLVFLEFGQHIQFNLSIVSISVRSKNGFHVSNSIAVVLLIPQLLVCVAT